MWKPFLYIWNLPHHLRKTFIRFMPILLIIGTITLLFLTIAGIFALKGNRGTLILKPEGVLMHTIFGNEKFFPWAEIEELYVMNIGVTSRIDIHYKGKKKTWGSDPMLTGYDYSDFTHTQLAAFK